MRYAMLIPDGAADRPHADLGGKTPLDVAALPGLARMAREGLVGLAATIPDGLPPGSDIANLALLGYDARENYTGRAALEAAAHDVPVPEGDAVFRANLVTVENGIMEDHSAGHITTAEARELIAALARDLDIEGVSLYPGVSYRHLCVIEAMAAQIPVCTPPHDILGRPIGEHAPQGGFSSWVLEIERTSAERLPTYEVNRRRRAAGRREATQLWLWAGSTPMRLPPFRERWGREGALISAVDLLKGIARLAGLEAVDVPGATGGFDTDYAAKGRAALETLRRVPFLYLHVEAPDEAGHQGDAAEKVRALEAIDRDIVLPLLAEADRSRDLRLLVVPDHPTPLELRTHSRDPVPYLLWGPGVPAGGADAFTEAAALRTGGAPVPGLDLLECLFRK